MCIIIAFLLVAILGPLIRPDDSAKANQQHLELSRKQPGFSVEMLEIENEQEGQTALSYWLFGEQSAERTIPVQQYSKKEGEFRYLSYSNYLQSKSEWDTLKYAGDEVENYKQVFLLGTDRYGRDMLSRLMAGTWISFSVGLISVLISLIIGISLGAMAGYFKGKVDDFIMWLINVVWSIPTLLLVIAITLALGKGFWQVFVAVGLTMWVEVARVTRGQVLSAREKEYVEAGKAFGYSNARVIFRHILPNISGPIIVISASNFAAAILIEAGLSFLGLGAQPPQATWGKMISEHKGYIITGDAYLAILPGIAIFLLVLSFVLVGNGLRDAFDSKGSETVNL